MTSPNQEVRYDIIIDAKASLEMLKALLKATSDNDQKIKVFTNSVVENAKKWGVSWQYALNVYKQLNAELSKQHKQTILGKTGGQDLIGKSEEYLKAADAAGRLGKATADVSAQTEKTSQSMNNAENSAHGFRRGIDAVRIAMGTLVAVGIFTLKQFVENTIRKAIESVKQLELAIYKVKIAEESLSESGVDITLQDFRDTIDEIIKLYPFISKIDATKLVGDIALLTKDLKLGNEQLKALMTAIPALAVQAGVTVDQATQQVINGLTTSGRGWKDLGIVVDANIIKQRAIADRIVASADAYNRLTAEQKQQVEVQALINILTDSANKVMSTQGELTNSVTGSTRELTGAWENLTTAIGEVTRPLLIPFLQGITNKIREVIQKINIFRELLTNFVANIAAMGIAVATVFQGNIHSVDEFKKVFLAAFKEIKAAAMDIVDLNIGTEDTPTNRNVAVEIKPEIDISKAEDAIEKLEDDLRNLNQKEIKINLEFNVKMSRMAEDHAVDMRRMEEDYQNKRAEIVADANRKRKEIEHNYRQKEKDDEAKFQEEMRQLRARFLFDLEDALHERDARQVLRLMEKYRLDKEAMINEHALKKQEDKRQHQDEMARLDQEKKDRLAQLDEEQAIKVQRAEEDYQLKKKREMEEHQQDLLDLKREREERLQEAAKAIAKEFDLKGQGAKAIYDMLYRFYGPNGAYTNLFDYTNDYMVGSTAQLLAQLENLVKQYNSITSNMNNTLPKPGTSTTNGTIGGRPYVGRQAKGGTYLATRPTTATFGEAGAELATFIPLGRPGASGGLLGASLGQEGGKISIEMLLSPDLEARVINNTMNKTADVILRTVRSK